MNLFKVSCVSIFVFLSLLIASHIEAADTQIPESQKAVIVANVSVHNAKIISQKDNKINISFNISNGDGVQAGVKYSVRLIKETTEGQFVVDEYISPEVFTLSAGKSIEKTITYEAPENLNGDYTVLITVMNDKGLTLGLGVAGKANLISSELGLEILTDSCYLTIDGEKDTKYYLTQGVDIKSDENLKLNCSVINHINKDISAIPTFETHYKTMSGDIVSQIGGDKTAIVFAPNEKKDISLTLTKAKVPQVYDVKTSLMAGDEISNPVIVHYILRGLSGTISNFSLDKDSYSKGDIANISLFWNYLSDSKDNPGIKLSATMKNDKGKDCIAPMDQDLNNAGVIDFKVPVISNCRNPIVTAELKGPNGNILDEKILSFESVSTKSSSVSSNLILIALGIIILVVIIVFITKMKKKQNDLNMMNKMVAMLFVVGAMFAFSSKVNAQTSYFDYNPGVLTVSTQLDRSVYSKGIENNDIVITSGASVEIDRGTTANVKVSAQIIGPFIGDNSNVVFGDPKTIIDTSLEQDKSNIYAMDHFEIPSEAGNYAMRITTETSTNIRGIQTNMYDIFFSVSTSNADSKGVYFIPASITDIDFHGSDLRIYFDKTCVKPGVNITYKMEYMPYSFDLNSPIDNEDNQLWYVNYEVPDLAGQSTKVERFMQGNLIADQTNSSGYPGNWVASSTIQGPWNEGSYGMKVQFNINGDVASQSIPFQVNKNGICDGSTPTTDDKVVTENPIAPGIEVWSDVKSVLKGGDTNVNWKAWGLDNSKKQAYCYRSDKPNDKLNYPEGSINTDKLNDKKSFTIVCTDEVSNTSTSSSSSEPKPISGPSVYYPTCFTKDTLVTLADGTKKNIQDVEVGNILKGELSNNKVLGLHRPDLNGKLYSINGGRYFVTEEHPFKTTTGWRSINPRKTEKEDIGIKVGTLHIGDTLITDSGLVKIKSIKGKSASKETNLYNFMLDGDHTYYADGYLVHNKLPVKSCNPGESCLAGVCSESRISPCAITCNSTSVDHYSCKTGYAWQCQNGSQVCVKGAALTD